VPKTPADRAVRAAPSCDAARRRVAPYLLALLFVGMGTAGVWNARADGPVPVPRPDPSDDLATLTADTHLRYTRGQLPLQVGSSRPDVVSAFFSGRVPFHLALPDYPVGPGESKPYRLLGGRVVSFRNDQAATAWATGRSRCSSRRRAARSRAAATPSSSVRSSSTSARSGA
jgi:hypothetical protein